MLRSADEERVALERSLEPRRARIMELQLQEQAARLAVEQFAEQLTEHQVDRQKLRELLEQRPDEWRRPNWLQSEVQRISRSIDSLGSVNLAATEAVKAASERNWQRVVEGKRWQARVTLGGRSYINTKIEQ